MLLFSFFPIDRYDGNNVKLVLITGQVLKKIDFRIHGQNFNLLGVKEVLV